MHDEDDLPAATETAALGSPNCLVVGLDCRSMNPYRFLRVRFPTIPKGRLQRWLSEGSVRVNGAPLTESLTLRVGDVLEIDADLQRLPRRRHLGEARIVFEDEAVLVADKPSGMPVQPEDSQRGPDLHTQVRERSIHGSAKHGLKLVHRLDKYASGLVVFVHGRAPKQQLIEDLRTQRLKRDFLALVSGPFPSEPRAELLRITAGSGARRHQVSSRRGRQGCTLVRRSRLFRGYSLVHARPLSALPHQLRLHVKHLGHAVVGDSVYQGEAALLLSRIKPGYRAGRGEVERPLLSRLALHAAWVELVSPASGETVTCRSALPKDLAAALRQLEKALGCEEESGTAGDFLRDPLGGLGSGEDPFHGVEVPSHDPEAAAEGREES